MNKGTPKLQPTFSSDNIVTVLLEAMFSTLVSQTGPEAWGGFHSSSKHVPNTKLFYNALSNNPLFLQ